MFSKLKLFRQFNKNLRFLSIYPSIQHSKILKDIETKIFRHLKTPYERFYVPIYDNKYKIWTLKTNPNVDHNIPIVLIHGCFASIIVWRYNIDALSESRPLYAIDLLGFGQSTRPKFSQDPLEVENQFVESIEEWRKKLNLNKFILLGHSLGGFLSSSYTLRYPQYIQALILNDPWGFNDSAKEDLSSHFKNIVETTYRHVKSKFDVKTSQYVIDSLLFIKYFYYADYYKRKRYYILFVHLNYLLIYSIEN
jgi:pimeloyl-ACP methyl ester carboxylesterase